MVKLESDIIKQMEDAENKFLKIRRLVEEKCFEICDFIIKLSKSEPGEYGWYDFDTVNDDNDGYFDLSYHKEIVTFLLFDFDYISDLYAIINGVSVQLVNANDNSVKIPTELIYQDFEDKITEGIKEWEKFNEYVELKSRGTPLKIKKEQEIKQAKLNLGKLEQEKTNILKKIQELENE